MVNYARPNLRPLNPDCLDRRQSLRMPSTNQPRLSISVPLPIYGRNEVPTANLQARG